MERMVLSLWKESVAGYYHHSTSDRCRVQLLSSHCSSAREGKDNGCVEARMIVRLCEEDWAEGAM